MNKSVQEKVLRMLQFGVHKIVFRSNSLEGKIFDTALLSLIFLSVITVMLLSIEEVKQTYGTYLLATEMVVTAMFFVEYVFRIVLEKNPKKFIFSTYGIIDFLAIFPAYFFWFQAGSNFFLLLRVIRILRIFRVFDLTKYTGEAKVLSEALTASRAKITVFTISVVSIVIVIGFLMYIIERDNPGFSSIPKSIFWAIVTLTTVGYGDVVPITALGKFLASVVMLIGYGVIAVPTGIVSAEFTSKSTRQSTAKTCLVCSLEVHDSSAMFCKHCGSKLWEY